MLGLLGSQPLHDAVDVEAMTALSPNQRTVVTSKLAIRAATIESYTTNATSVVIG